MGNTTTKMVNTTTKMRNTTTKVCKKIFSVAEYNV